jgi:hypothetical protein
MCLSGSSLLDLVPLSTRAGGRLMAFSGLGVVWVGETLARAYGLPGGFPGRPPPCYDRPGADRLITKRPALPGLPRHHFLQEFRRAQEARLIYLSGVGSPELLCTR